MPAKVNLLGTVLARLLQLGKRCCVQCSCTLWLLRKQGKGSHNDTSC